MRNTNRILFFFGAGLRILHEVMGSVLPPRGVHVLFHFDHLSPFLCTINVNKYHIKPNVLTNIIFLIKSRA